MKATIYRVSLGILVLGTSFSVSASELFGVRYPAATDLYRVSQISGAISSIGPSGQDNIGDLTSDTRPGSPRIWGVRIPSNQLFSFNPLSGAASLAAQLNSTNNMVSIAFDPVAGKLYGNTSIGFGAPFDALYQIDPTTGNTTFIGRIGFDNVFALAFDQGGHLFGIADGANQLIGISTATGNGAFIASLGLGLSFDIASRPEDNTMFLANSTTSSLYTLDTVTGNMTLVGPYGVSENIVGLAFSAVPEPSALAFATLLATLAMVRHLRHRR